MKIIKQKRADGFKYKQVNEGMEILNLHDESYSKVDSLNTDSHIVKHAYGCDSITCFRGNYSLARYIL